MKFLFAAVAGALVLAAAPAMAADDGGFYVGAGIGNYGVDAGGFSGSDVGYKVFGGWMFNKYIGGELEYADGGTAEDHGFGIDVSGFNASIKGNWPVTEQFDVFAKVGYVFWDVKGSHGLHGSDSGEDFSWGVGAGFNFTDNVGATLEYQGYEIKDTDTVDFISASVIWKF